MNRSKTPTWRWPTAVALVVGLWAGQADAQAPPGGYASPPAGPPGLLFSGSSSRPSGSPYGQPRPTQVGRYAPGVRLAQATTGDMPQPEAPAPATPRSEEPITSPDLSLPRAESASGGGEPTEAEGEAEEAKADVPILTKILGMEDSPVKIYGWIQNSYTGNTNGKPKSGLNFGVNPNNLANSWQGNQYYTIIENVLEQNDEVNFGYRFDSLFGNDATFNHMHGLFDTGYKVNHFQAWDPAQFYAEVHLPVLTKGGIDIKGGRWYTIAGYEVVPATGRPLLSVPYMFNYGQPFTHLGAISTWHVTDKLNIYNGTINGWDRWVNSTYKWGYIGGWAWTSKSGNSSWAMTVVWGPNQFPRFLPADTRFVPTGTTVPPFLAGRRNLGYGSNDRLLFTNVFTHKWNDKLTQVIETDEAFENNVPGFGPGGTNNNASWYSFGNWFLYAFNDKLTGVWRSEIFRDNNGVRTGFATNFSEITLGMIYKPQSWLWIRPEARYDWARSGHPYNDGTRNSQLTLGFDVILLY